MSSTTVYVGNLDWSIRSDELEEHMSKAGRVVRCNIPQDFDGRSKGFALVEFDDESAASKAIDIMHDTTLGNRPISVREDRGKGKGKGKDREDKGFGKGRDSGKGYGKDRDFDKGWGKGKDSDKGFRKGGRDFEKGEGKGKGKSKFGPEDAGRVLYVGNLPFRASWQSVKDRFKEHGDIIRVETPEGPDGRSRGYALVLFADKQDAEAAIDALNGEDFEGRSLVVRLDNAA